MDFHSFYGLIYHDVLLLKQKIEGCPVKKQVVTTTVHVASYNLINIGCL